jgi:hypothetical protein
MKARAWLQYAAGSFLAYLMLQLTLYFLLERQPSTFIYVSF